MLQSMVRQLRGINRLFDKGIALSLPLSLTTASLLETPAM